MGYVGRILLDIFGYFWIAYGYLRISIGSFLDIKLDNIWILTGYRKWISYGYQRICLGYLIWISMGYQLDTNWISESDIHWIFMDIMWIQRGYLKWIYNWIS